MSVRLRLKEKSDSHVNVSQVGVERNPHRFQGRSRGKWSVPNSRQSVSIDAQRRCPVIESSWPCFSTVVMCC